MAATRTSPPASPSSPIALTVEGRSALPLDAPEPLASLLQPPSSRPAGAACVPSVPVLRRPARGATVRAARPSDVPGIARLVAHWASVGEHLPRPVSEIERSVGDFQVAESEGAVIACASLVAYESWLVELRSVGVDPAWQGSGVGARVVDRAIAEAGSRGFASAFVLTRVPAFFAHLGFLPVPLAHLPGKVRRDCDGCARRDACDEVAMIRPVTRGGVADGG